MDAGGYTPREIRGNLHDLRFLNRWTRGARIVEREVGSLLRASHPARARTLLDVATGSADIPRRLSSSALRAGVPLLALGIDSNPEVLGESKRWQGDVATAARLVRGDARRLPWGDRSVDVVICSNFLHHLDGNEARMVLAEMRRVARIGVVVVDLVRTRVAWGLVWLVTRLVTTNRLTRHDGPLSVERAFTVEEMRGLADEAGLAGAVVRAAGPVRMVLRWRAT